MIETVLFFGAINIVAEMIFLGMVPPRIRLAILGSRVASGAVHIVMLVLTMAVHWGTLLGTMGAFAALILSFPAVWIARLTWGFVRVTTNSQGIKTRKFRRGIINYRIGELT